MKKFISILLCLMMVLSLVACGPANTDTDTSAPETEITEEVTDLNADARAMLEDAASAHLCDENFVNTVLTQVPDIFLLEDIRYACYTFFLELTCGTEFIVITNDVGTIQTIAYWLGESNEMGHILYEVE